MADRHKFNSTNKVAETKQGNKLRQYIAEMATLAVARERYRRENLWPTSAKA
jgi:hypothetical protein